MGTENGANGSNGAAVVAAENGAEVEEEEDVDEEDEEALGEEEEGEGEEDLDEEAEGEEGEEEEDGEGEEEEEGDDYINYFYFVVTQPRHFVLHIPNTPPHHHLCSFDEKKRGKKRSTASVRNIPQSNGSKNAQKIPIQRAKCQTNPPSKKTTKNIAKRWCFLSKKQKRILSSPFKNKTKQKF